MDSCAFGQICDACGMRCSLSGSIFVSFVGTVWLCPVCNLLQFLMLRFV